MTPPPAKQSVGSWARTHKGEAYGLAGGGAIALVLLLRKLHPKTGTPSGSVLPAGQTQTQADTTATDLESQLQPEIDGLYAQIQALGAQGGGGGGYPPPSMPYPVWASSAPPTPTPAGPSPAPTGDPAQPTATPPPPSPTTIVPMPAGATSLTADQQATILAAQHGQGPFPSYTPLAAVTPTAATYDLPYSSKQIAAQLASEGYWTATYT